MYGVGPGFAYDAGGSPVDPLGPDLATRDEWWFRGPRARALPPQNGAVMTLPAGGSITFEIAVSDRDSERLADVICRAYESNSQCHYAWTSYGYATTVPGSELDACPGPNAGPWHVRLPPVRGRFWRSAC